MQKTPIILPIVPSKTAGLLHSGLAMGLCSLSYWVLGLWVGSGITFVISLLLWRTLHRQVHGVLYLSKRDTAIYGRWRKPYGELSDEVVVRCDYLGPWLVGLWVGPQRLWLWPDSFSRHHHRLLRRLYHRAGH
ncbi:MULTISPECIES: hypothetical protein [Halomonas]|uniref:hypothetical protein n=1 Tax=Halomonas TaxID=2745 RepID=UPI001D027FFC|nr:MULTISPECIES: hypothetical protein [Halomonas]